MPERCHILIGMAQTEEMTTVSQTIPVQVTKTTKRVVPSSLEEETPKENYETKKAIFRVYQVIWYALGIMETLIALRIFLKASGANPGSGFVNVIYSLSEPLVFPFASMFRTVIEAEFIFELHSFVAGIVWLLVATGLVELFQLLKPTTPQEVEENV